MHTKLLHAPSTGRYRGYLHFQWRSQRFWKLETMIYFYIVNIIVSRISSLWCCEVSPCGSVLFAFSDSFPFSAYVLLPWTSASLQPHIHAVVPSISALLSLSFSSSRPSLLLWVGHPRSGHVQIMLLLSHLFPILERVDCTLMHLIFDIPLQDDRW